MQTCSCSDLLFLALNGTGVFSRTGILCCAGILRRARILRRTGISRARVPASHLLFRHQPLLLPGLHSFVDLGSQRGYVRIEIDVLLRVRVHWLTAKEDGVSEVIH